MSSVWFLQSFPQIASPLVGKLVDRHGTRLSFCIGFTTTAFALTCMALVQQDSIVEVGIFGTMIVVMNVGTLLVVIPSMVGGPFVSLLLPRFSFWESNCPRQAYLNLWILPPNKDSQSLAEQSLSSVLC